jgi:hypothetical protein
MIEWKNTAYQTLCGVIGGFMAYLVYNALAFDKAWPFTFFPRTSELSRALHVFAYSGWSVAMFALVLVRWQMPETARRTLFIAAALSIIGTIAFVVLATGHIVARIR